MTDEQAPAHLDAMPSARLAGVELTAAAPEEVTGRLARQAERDARGRHVAQVTQTQAVQLGT